jgi:endo-1,4-beta-xylanase
MNIKTQIISGFVLLYLMMTGCTRNFGHHDDKINKPFKLGAAISWGFLKNSEEYRNTVKDNFQSVTFTNEMKMKHLQKTEGIWDFSRVDSMINFALENDLQVHGHTLVWHYGNPPWVDKYSGDSARLEEIMKQHIRKVVTHCKGRVVSWDVVNEAISDTTENYYRKTIWYRNLGEGFIERAFRYAHEADPQAKLFYNEYGTERDTLKFSKTIEMVRRLQEKGVPIHGIGFQMHTQVGWPPVSLVDSVVKEAVATGLLIHFSEVDVSVNGLTTKIGYLTSFENDMIIAQKERYGQFAEIFNRIPESQQFAFTTWGVHDGSSWLRNHYIRNKPEWPLLFDDNFLPKPAFHAIQLIRNNGE